MGKDTGTEKKTQTNKKKKMQTQVKQYDKWRK